MKHVLQNMHIKKANKVFCFFLILFCFFLVLNLNVAKAGQGDDCSYPEFLPNSYGWRKLKTQTFTKDKSPYCFDIALGVPATETLTFEPGTVIKFGTVADSYYRQGAGLGVRGKMFVNGTKDSPVVFTSIYDDIEMGDTNNDGHLTQPNPRDWNKIQFFDNSESKINYAVFKYGAHKSPYMLNIEKQANISITNSVIKNSGGHGAFVHDKINQFSFNKIYNNAVYGVYGWVSEDNKKIDIRYNWWGSAGGPLIYGVNENLDPLAQKIGGSSGNNNIFLYDPWLTTPDEEIPLWRRNIQAGDILYVPYAAGVGHTAMYVGSGKIIEAQGDVKHPFDSNLSKVKENSINKYDYPDRTNIYLLRVKKPTGISDSEWQLKKHNAIEFVTDQFEANKPYDWGWFNKSYDANSSSWYCSELVWAAYYNQGINLEHYGDADGFLSPVSPAEIFLDNDTYIISGHHEEIKPSSWRNYVLLMVLSPIEIRVIDPDGNILTKDNIGIPGATYLEDYVDAAGHIHDRIYLPNISGEYQIQVIREIGANDNETYSLTVSDVDGNTKDFLAQDRTVPELEQMHEYVFNPNNIVSSGTGFFDTEYSNVNIFTTGTLDLDLQTNVFFKPTTTPAQNATSSLQISNSGTLNFKYDIKANNLSADVDFCNALGLKVLKDGSQIYNGSLIGFSKNLSVLNSGNSDNFEFEVSLLSDNFDLQNKICNFDFVFQSWQEGNNTYSSEQGFSDYEVNSVSISSGNWQTESEANLVINKVYYDVVAGDQKEGDNEWVEIYNAGENAVDISGWQICDNHACDLIPDSQVIPALGYAIITASSTTWNFLYTATSTVEIVLDSKIGNGLANNSDRVILVDLDLEQVDAISYGDDVYAFDPACEDVAEGNVLSRIVGSKDTDSADDWEEIQT